jgi:hypothetical protein
MTRECDQRVQELKKSRVEYFRKMLGASIQFECVVKANLVGSDRSINCDHANGSIQISNSSSKCSGPSEMRDAYLGDIRTCFTGKVFPKDRIKVEAKIASFSDCLGIVAARSVSDSFSCDRIQTPIIDVGGYYNGDLGPVVITIK